MFIDRYVYFNQKSPQKDGRNNLERTIVELALHATDPCASNSTCVLLMRNYLFIQELNFFNDIKRYKDMLV